MDNSEQKEKAQKLDDENNSKTIDKLRQKNSDENRKINIILKKQLKEISTQIEELFIEQEKQKNNKIKNSIDYSNKIDIQEFTNFQSKIDRYKKKIESKQKEINNNFEYENIIKNENEYKSITSRLLSLKKENEILTKITKQLNDQLIEANGGSQINSQTVQMSEKLKFLKEEIKLMNDNSKILTKKIKVQNAEINELNQYISKVKSNIDYAKYEQEQANKKEDYINDEKLLKKIIELKDEIKKLEIEKKRTRR